MVGDRLPYQLSYIELIQTRGTARDLEVVRKRRRRKVVATKAAKPRGD